MDRNTVIEKLMLFGLTRQEATIYLELLENHESSGYEVAKNTGISRSNVYGALSGLVEKGASYILEGETTKYTAVPIEEFCSAKLRHLDAEKDYLIEHVQFETEQSEGYITIEGFKHVVDKIHFMLLNTKERVYLSADAAVIDFFMPELKMLLEKQIKVVLISNRKYGNSGAISYVVGDGNLEKEQNQIRLITDSAFVLTGDIKIEKSATCLYSGQKNFVRVFKDALRNEIKLIELGVENHGN